MSNFKAVGSAELAPVRLTVISGANSSGKSSLLQSALFFAQSYGQPQTVINGDLVRLGEPTDVVRDGADEVGLDFLYNVSRRNEQGHVVVAGAFGLHVRLAAKDDNLVPVKLSLRRDEEVVFEANERGALQKLPLTADEVALRIADAHALALPDESYLTVAGLTPQRLIFRASETALRKDFEGLMTMAQDGSNYALDELVRMPRYAEKEELAMELSRRVADLRHGRVQGEQPLFGLLDSEREALFRSYVEVQAPGGWSSEPIGMSYPRSRAMRHPGLQDDESDDYLQMLARVGVASDRMERLASSIRYLGPLREDPRVAYPLGHTVRNLPVGEKGEFTAAYLERNRRTSVRYVRPNGTRASGLLWSAVSEWCDYLGIAEKVTVTSQGKLGHQLGLEVGGHERDPTAVGVGASQLLPVVVLVLGAPDDAVVFLEQPELHLHPKVQSRLGDFFAFARPTIRLIVETHSEYLITRLRLRAAEGSFDVTDLAVLFASQRRVEPLIAGPGVTPDVFTEFTRLSLDELGDFSTWPENFFDTLSHDTVELAQAISRRLEGRQSGPR